MQTNEKILVIMSKGSYANSIIESLRNRNYVAILENTGAGGIKKILESTFSLIIIDTQLSDMDGYAILEKKNAESLLSRIPVFLVSSNGEAINMRKVPENSVSEFIVSMDHDSKQIVDKIDKYLGNTGKTASSGKAKKILWVEDDKLIGTILSKKLISSGFDLTRITNGSEAMDLLSKDSTFDAILLDLILPGIGGFDILEKIKTTEATKDIPVMILSNLSKPSDIERAKIMGAKKFIVKAAASLDKIVMDTKEICR